jgi:nicotinate-nucleotide adenylyltransferase
MVRLIGILGGTFDPIHYGHIKPVLELQQALGLAEVRFIPNRVPPHRPAPWLDSASRRRLVATALADYPGFVLDERELRREGPSFMVDTLAELQQAFPQSSLCLILGTDAFAGFTRWHRWQAILELCHLIVITRPGAALPDFGDQQPLINARLSHDAQALAKSHCGQILIQSVTPIDISATMIRHRLSQGQSIAGLVPESIREQLETRYAI